LREATIQGTTITDLRLPVQNLAYPTHILAWEEIETEKAD